MTALGSPLGRLGAWEHLATLPAAELRPFVRRFHELGCGAPWIGHGRYRDPLAQLGTIARPDGATDHLPALEALAPASSGRARLRVAARDLYSRACHH